MKPYRWKMGIQKQTTHVATTFHTKYDTLIKAINRMREIIEILRISPQLEPRARKTSSSSLLEIMKRHSRTIPDKLQVCTTSGKRCAEIDGFCNVGRHGIGHRLWIGDL
jgi:hypothetical protein